MMYALASNADREVIMKVLASKPNLNSAPAGQSRSRLLSSAWWVMLLLLVVPLAKAQEDEYETFMKQARLYIKKGWYRDAGERASPCHLHR